MNQFALTNLIQMRADNLLKLKPPCLKENLDFNELANHKRYNNPFDLMIRNKIA